MTLTAGVDVGSSAVKCAVVRSEGASVELLAATTGRIRRREPRAVVAQAWEEALVRAGTSRAEISYVATSGEGELVEFRDGHFYGMTAHARGALFIDPRARAALDVGALHARAIRMD